MRVGGSFFMIGIDRAHRVVSGVNVGKVAESEETNLCVFFWNFHVLSFFCVSYRRGRVFSGIIF